MRKPSDKRVATLTHPNTSARPVRFRCALLAALVLAAGPACADAPEGGGDGAGGAAAADSAGTGGDADASSSKIGLPAMAITIDDLPWVGPLPDGWTRLEGTARILAALEAHGAPATGFVNCARVQEGAPVLRRWLEAGQRLGNHTASHPDLNRAEPSAWAADARECDGFLRELTGEPALPFRYPFLHRGPTPERYRAGRGAIDSLGSTVAPVTIDTGDWILNGAYVTALRAGDETRARVIADAYLDHVVRAADHYRDVARERVGRDIRHILLLHANALLADWLDALLDRLEEDGFRFITLDAALEDPVYTLEDEYIGPGGLSWLYRIPPATPGAAAWDDAEAAALREVIR